MRATLGVALLLLIVPMGCSDDDNGGDACTKACDKIKSCNPGTTTCSITGACTGESKKKADCINASPCDKVVECLLGGGSDSGVGSDTGGGGTKCEQLAKKCPLCTLPTLKATCNAAVATNDEKSCQDGLSDPDVISNCK